MEINVNSTILVPGKDMYPLYVKVFLSFFENPLKALTKNNKQDIIIEAMRQKITQKLIYKLLAIHASELHTAGDVGRLELEFISTVLSTTNKSFERTKEVTPTTLLGVPTK